MIVVTGSVRGRAGTIERIVELSLEHVRRSREEPGCLLHSVHVDAEDPLRLVFLEHWADEAALARHFGVPASRAFVRALAELSDGPPELRVFEAAEKNLGPTL